MIQRIQSIWLILAAACAGALFIPTETIGTPGENPAMSTITNIGPTSNPIILYFAIAIIVFSITALINYKNRKIQKTLCVLVLLLSLGCLAYMIGAPVYRQETFAFEIELIAPLLSFVFSLLAYRGINKDDKLVKNLDRLR